MAGHTNDLVTPMIFVAHGDPLPTEWMDAHPGWIRIPALMVTRNAAPGANDSTAAVPPNDIDVICARCTDNDDATSAFATMPTRLRQPDCDAPARDDAVSTAVKALSHAQPISADLLRAAGVTSPTNAAGRGMTFADAAHMLLCIESAQAQVSDDSGARAASLRLAVQSSEPSHDANSIGLSTESASRPQKNIRLAAAADDPQGIRMAKDAARAGGLTTKEQRQKFHRAISKEGIESFQDLVDIARSIKETGRE